MRDQSARAADGVELLQNGGAGLPDVLPDPLHERLAAEVEAGEALLGEQPLDHVLGGDAGVIGARQPEGAAAAHPLEAHQHILHVLLRPCPMCSTAVTLGGGIMIT